MILLSKDRLTNLTDSEQQIALTFVDKIQQQFSKQLISVTLFGSRARGEAESDSDMDILVVLSKTDLELRRAIHDLAVEVWLEYGIFLSIIIWSEAHRDKVAQLNTSFYQNIQRDGIDLLNHHTTIHNLSES